MTGQHNELGAKRTALVAAGVAVVVIALALALISFRNPSSSEQNPPRITYGTECGSGQPAHDGLDKSSNRQLRKLAEYEEVCGGDVTGTMMLFVQMPKSSEMIEEHVAISAVDLKEYEYFGIKPLVVFEPLIEDLEILLHIQQGVYDDILEQYFRGLKDYGVTDDMIGTWVLFPEANTPTWHNTDPKVYSSNVSKVSGMLRRHFPDVEVSTLLNSKSYPTGDMDWSDGGYLSLVPYLDHLEGDTVDMVGYQGFPWLPPANDPTGEPVTDAGVYLRADLAMEAAKTVGIDHVWLNTGTFGQAYVNDPSRAIWVSTDQRKAMLESVLIQVKALLDAGLKVSVNLFAENKIDSNEGIDWSYWTAGQTSLSDSTPVFKGFVGALRELGADFTLYDAAPPF